MAFSPQLDILQMGRLHTGCSQAKESRVALATELFHCQIFWSAAGGEIASTFDKPEAVKLGSCKLIEEIMIGEDKLIHFSGVEMGEACTIILRGASEHSPVLPAHKHMTIKPVLLSFLHLLV